MDVGDVLPSAPVAACQCTQSPRQCEAAQRSSALSLLHRLSLVLATALTVHVTGPVRADDFPSRPLRVIVPFSPGGAVDGPMRLIAQAPEPAPRPARRRREQARRRRDDRHRRRGQGGARRVHAAARVADQRDQRDALLEAAVRSDRGLHAGRADRSRARRRRREPGGAGDLAAATDRVREGATRPGRLRIVGQRQRTAPVRRPARVADRHEDEPRALSRQRPGDDRSSRRRGGDVDPRHCGHGRPHQGREACARSP